MGLEKILPRLGAGLSQAFHGAMRTPADPEIRWVITFNDVVQRPILAEMLALIATVSIPLEVHLAATTGYRAAFHRVGFLSRSRINHIA